MENINTASCASASSESVCPHHPCNRQVSYKSPVEQELSLLQSWCSQAQAENSVFLYNPKEFYEFFCTALQVAEEKYHSNKKKAWDLKIYVLYSVGYVLASGASAIVTQLILDKISSAPSKTAMGITGGVLITGAIMTSIKSWRDKRAYDETWARHSARYHRLRLILKQFLLSQKTAKEFNLFAQKTFAILERNLDQFELNISSKGLAEAKAIDMEGI